MKRKKPSLASLEANAAFQSLTQCAAGYAAVETLTTRMSRSANRLRGGPIFGQFVALQKRYMCKITSV
jgi:hypothetical protein